MAGPRAIPRNEIEDGPAPSEDEVIFYDIFLGWLEVFSVENDQLYADLARDEEMTVDEVRKEIEDAVASGRYVRYAIDEDHMLLVHRLDEGDLKWRRPPHTYPVHYLGSPLRKQLAPVLQEILATAGGELTEDDKDWVCDVLGI